MENSKSKYNINEWLSLQRIRLLSFIKNHKYISVGIFSFLLIGLIGMIVFAVNDNYNVDVSSVSINSVSNANKSDDASIAKSFSKISFNLNYKVQITNENDESVVDGRTIVIDGSLPSNIDAEWIREEMSDADVDISTNTDKNSIKVTIYNVNAKKNLSDILSRSISLDLGNLANDTTFDVTFKIYDEKNTTQASNDYNDNLVTEKIKISSSEVKLVPKVVPGKSFKKYFDKTESNSKFASFNILLGVDDSIDSLEGKYFSKDYNIELLAEQKETGAQDFTSTSLYTNFCDGTDSNCYVYDADLSSQYFLDENVPSGIYSDSKLSVYNSGDTKLEGNVLKLTNYESKNYLTKYKTTDADPGFITLGSYFVLVKTNLLSGNIKLTASNDSNSSEGMLEVLTTNKGTSKYDVSLYRNSGEKLPAFGTVSFGEEILVSSNYTLSADADQEKEVSVILPMNESSSNKFDLIQYDTTKLYNTSKDTTKINVYYCTDIECSNSHEIPTNNNNISAIAEADKDSVKALKYVTTVEPAEKVTFEFKIKARENITGSATIINTSKVYEKNSTTPEITSVYTMSVLPNTPSLEIRSLNGEQNISVNGANTNNSTIVIYPSILSEAANVVNPNSLKVFVVLPKNIEYVPNDDYKLPTFDTSLKSSLERKIGDDKLNYDKVLVYDYNGAEANSYIEPIKLDISYDSKLQNGIYKIYSYMLIDYDGTLDISANNDYSTFEINYYYDEAVATKLYSNKSTVLENNDLEINFDLYNRSSSIIEGENYSYITLPNINEHKYSLKQIDTENMEYTSDSSIDTATWKKFTSANISYEDLLASGINKIRVKYGSIAVDTTVSKKITLLPIEAKEAEVYEFAAEYKTSSRILKINVASKNISGIVWEDFNENGVMDAKEKRIRDVSFTLYKLDGTEVDSTTSNEKGEYIFNKGIVDGSYYIVANYNKSKYGLTDKLTDKKSLNSSYSYDEDLKIVKTDTIVFDQTTNNSGDNNLGLTLNKEFKIKVSKFLTKAIIVNNNGETTEKDLENQTTAKLDVKDIEKLNIKIIYTIELENTASYPGYIFEVKDYIPDGMSFNPDYPENEGWIKTADNYVLNNSLSDTLIYGGQKKYLTLALDIVSKDITTFVNKVRVDDEDLQILDITEIKDGDIKNESDDNSGQQENPNDDYNLPPKENETGDESDNEGNDDDSNDSPSEEDEKVNNQQNEEGESND